MQFPNATVLKTDVAAVSSSNVASFVKARTSASASGEVKATFRAQYDDGQAQAIIDNCLKSAADLINSGLTLVLRGGDAGKARSEKAVAAAHWLGLARAHLESRSQPHTVKSGEYISHLTKKYYGEANNSKLWQKLVDANAKLYESSGVAKSYNNIRAGWTMTIPPKLDFSAQEKGLAITTAALGKLVDKAAGSSSILDYLNTHLPASG